MKPRDAIALETQLLLQLVARVKDLNILIVQESGVLNLKCPCGTVILPATPVITNVRDRQRGLLKSRLRDHLRAGHGLSEQTIRVVLNKAFVAD
jgi:hypothetical protein